MTPPVISIFSAAARPENWMALYDNVADCDVTFEIVFVGPNAPVSPLPENCRYIKSNVKPVQAFEIGARHATGSLLMWTADDILFTSGRPLQNLYDVYVAQNDDKVIVSSEYDRPVGWNHLGPEDVLGPDLLKSPEMPLNGLMSTKTWSEIQGIDRRFIAVGWEYDLTLRVLAIGGSVVMSDVYVGDEIELWPFPRSRGGSLRREYGVADGKLLDDLWQTNGKYTLHRNMPMESFSDEGLIRRSEAPQGRWRYENDRINRFITSTTFYSVRRIRRAIEGRIRRLLFAKLPAVVRRLTFRGR